MRNPIDITSNMTPKRLEYLKGISFQERVLRHTIYIYRVKLKREKYFLNVFAKDIPTLSKNEIKKSKKLIWRYKEIIKDLKSDLQKHFRGG